MQRYVLANGKIHRAAFFIVPICKGFPSLFFSSSISFPFFQNKNQLVLGKNCKCYTATRIICIPTIIYVAANIPLTLISYTCMCSMFSRNFYLAPSFYHQWEAKEDKMSPQHWMRPYIRIIPNFCSLASKCNIIVLNR